MDGKPLHIILTDDLRTALERVRKAMGARSGADAIRQMIAAADAPPVAQISVSPLPAQLQRVWDPRKDDQ